MKRRQIFHQNEDFLLQIRILCNSRLKFKLLAHLTTIVTSQTSGDKVYYFQIIIFPYENI